MEVEYNGVRFEQSEIQSIQREVVWDDSHSDVLYIRWVIGLIAFYSPNGYPPATSVKTLRPPAPAGNPFFNNVAAGIAAIFPNPFTKFRAWLLGTDALPSPVNLRKPVIFDAPANAKPIGGAGGQNTPPSGLAGAGINGSTGGYGPILTDVTLRNRLMTPRGYLKISGYDWSTPGTEQILIESPKPPYIADPANGPHPIACDILSGQDMGFAVFFQIETAQLPCDDNSDRLILSHRWQMSHTHDENQYLTRVIDGEVVLNGSMIATFGLNVDWLRSQLFHPIPLGHYRKVPHVTPSPDGLTYRYRIEDTDQTITFDAGDSGATHIDITEKVAYNAPMITKLHQQQFGPNQITAHEVNGHH